MALRIGIAGAGRVGAKKARRLEAYPDVELTGVADPNRPARDSFARAFGTKLAVSDHRRLAQDDTVDVVYVCSPPGTHSTIAIDSLTFGKHVICEQPMAVSMKQADEMLAAAEASEGRLFVALSERYDPVYHEVARILEYDEIGYPFLALAAYLVNDFDRLNDWHDWRGTWALGGGGVLIELGSGIIDLLQFCFGQVEAVSAVCTRFAIEPLNKAEDSCVLGLEFLEEATAELAITGAARFSAWPENYSGAASRLEIFGLDGSLRVGDSEPRLMVVTQKGRRQMESSEIRTDLPTSMDRDFLDCILDDRDPLVDPVHARDALRVILAGYKASQMKRRVETLEQL